MLSILIPIYNHNAFPLVEELHKQCLESKITFEILCQDDASQSVLNTFNEEINQLPNCSFISLKKNVYVSFFCVGNVKIQASQNLIKSLIKLLC